jgi:diguanylate cyclase (GGDEF)-like protein
MSAGWSRTISLSVRARIIGGFGALVVILVAVITGAAIQEQNHKSELARLDLHSRNAILLQSTEAQAAIAADGVQRYVYNGDPQYMAEINAAANSAQANLVQAAALGAPGSDQLAAVGAQLLQGASQALALRQAGDTADASAAVEAMVPIFHDYQLKLENTTSAELMQVTQLRASADRAGNLAFLLLVASGALGVVTALAVSFWVARSIVNPLAQLEVTARRASDGDLSARAPDRGPRELSHLGSVLNEMMSAIEKRTEDLRQANHHLTDARTQAATDPLTGLGNHRLFHKRLQDEAADAAAGSGKLGLVMMDLDGFKGVNDSLGHLAGDQLLREVASAIIEVVGDQNAYRYGGDEFAVLLPDGDQLTTMTTAESLKRAFLKIDHPTAGRVTASFGVASMPESASTPKELVYRADMAMYLAKSSGKNRVASWGEQASGLASPLSIDYSGARRG